MWQITVPANKQKCVYMHSMTDDGKQKCVYMCNVANSCVMRNGLELHNGLELYNGLELHTNVYELEHIVCIYIR